MRSFLIGALVLGCGWLPYYAADLKLWAVVRAFFEIMAALFMPGLIMTGFLGGNLHNASLTAAFILNAVLYSLCIFGLLSLFNRKRNSAAQIMLLLFFVSGSCLAQGQSGDVGSFHKAQQLFAEKKLPEAERAFAEIVRLHPENVSAEVYLGETLFEQQKFAEAIGPYEKVRSLEKSGIKLTLTHHRILVDQLAMAYGISGRTSDSKILLQESVRSDPQYPLNYYNLACVAADENDKPAVLKNLTLAFQHRDQVLPGENMPDPASDSSFQKYVQDSDFKALVTRLKN
jgi:tetratricopeptide (TPR) repeat protein